MSAPCARTVRSEVRRHDVLLPGEPGSRSTCQENIAKRVRSARPAGACEDAETAVGKAREDRSARVEAGGRTRH